MKKLSVIIINYNTPAMTERAIRAFKENTPNLDYEIILIDNNSSQKVSAKIIKELNLKYIVNGQNLGFARTVNQGIKAASAEYILLLNSDVIVEKGVAAELLAYLEKEESAGIIGPKFIYPDGKNQISSGRFPDFWRELFRFTLLYKILPLGVFNRDFKSVRLVDWLSGGCLLIKTLVIEQIGRFDENYFFGAEDKDFCLRAKRKGWQVVYCPEVQVRHYHGFSSGGRRATRRLEMERESENYFLAKNFPKKILARWLIRRMYNFKIIIFSLLGFGRRTKKYRPLDATIAITYKCNSRCRMCNIWRTKNPADLPLNYFYNLSRHLKYINLSGGEPFLRPDLPQIVKNIKRVSPKAKIIISTNGLASALIKKTTKQILAINKNIGVRISLDGLEEAHERIRGVAGIYRQVLKTVEALKSLGLKNLGFSFTVMDDNVAQLKAVYDLARDLGLELALAAVQNSEIYFKKNDNKLEQIKMLEDNLRYVVYEELKSRSIKRWFRAYYDYGLLYFAKHKKRLLASGAGFDSLFIDPAGHIFPSNLINLNMGNLGRSRLDKIWNSSLAAEVRRQIEEENITESWIICTIRGQMKRHLFKIAYWILKNKFYENSANK